MTPLYYSAGMSPSQQAKITSHIDKLIAKDLAANKQKPNAPINDETFLRRAYLDIIGRIPTISEYNDFMNSKDRDRRNKVIDKLFDSKGYTSHNYNYWADALRAKLTRGKTHLDAYQLWIKQSIDKNMPYDQFVKEMISSEGLLFQPGNGKVGYYNRDQGMLEDNLSNTMQLFLGTSVVCAQCHDHPYNRYTQMDYYKLLGFIIGTKLNYKSDLSLYPKDAKGRIIPGHKRKKMNEESMEGMVKKGKTGSPREQRKVQRATFIAMNHTGMGKIQLPNTYDYEDGKPNEWIKADVPYAPQVNINYDSSNGAKKPFYNYNNDQNTDYSNDVNSRMYFAQWITSKDNPMFTKTIVNRLWYRLWGTPLAGKLLDMKESDLGTNPELTKFLIKAMQYAKFDMKIFMKMVMKSKSYQRAKTQEQVSYKKFHFQGKYFLTFF